MRRFLSLIVLVVVLAGLVGYIYFVDRERADEDAKETVFAAVTADEVEEVQIKSSDGEQSRVRKADGGWRLVEPIEAEADRNELSSIASGLGTIDIQRVVDENAADLAQYGLEPARVEVTFRTKGQQEPRRLLLGEKTPTGGDMYARLPDQRRVFLVSSFLDQTFNKNTFALREKAVLKFDREKADGIELVGVTPLQLAKNESDWRLVKPFAARADYGAAEGSLERIATAQMHGIVDPEGKDLGKYGLDKPRASMTVTAGGQRSTLLIGELENALLYAKDASRPMVFTIAPTLQADVLKPPADYRRKDLFDARSFTVTRAEFKRGAETIALEKAKGADGKETWKNAAGATVDSAKVEDLLSRITALRADSFEPAAHPSLKTPALSVDVRYDGGKTESVTFGRAGDDVFASRSDEPGSARLDAAAFDEAVKALDAVN